MKIIHIEALVKGRTPHTTTVIESMKDVPEQYRGSGVPSWAGTYKMKRHLFNWVDRLGKARLFLEEPLPGVFTLRVCALFFKGWEFSVTPEQLFLLASVVSAVGPEEGVADITFTLSDRKFYLPFEMHTRFRQTITVIASVYGHRMISMQQALTEPLVVEDDEARLPGDNVGKAKRVLH